MISSYLDDILALLVSNYIFVEDFITFKSKVISTDQGIDERKKVRSTDQNQVISISSRLIISIESKPKKVAIVVVVVVVSYRNLTLMFLLLQPEYKKKNNEILMDFHWFILQYYKSLDSGHYFDFEFQYQLYGLFQRPLLCQHLKFCFAHIIKDGLSPTIAWLNMALSIHLLIMVFLLITRLGDKILFLLNYFVCPSFNLQTPLTPLQSVSILSDVILECSHI